MIIEVTTQSLMQRRFTAPKHYTWEELSFDFPFGSVFYLERVGSLMFMVRRCASSLAGYVGVPKRCKLRGMDTEEVSLWAHGGCCWAGRFEEKESYGSSEYYYNKLRDYYWFGWDYAHYEDCMMWNNKDDIPDYVRNSSFYGFGEDEYMGQKVTSVKWDLQMVLDDSEETVEQFIEYHRKVCGCRG